MIHSHIYTILVIHLGSFFFLSGLVKLLAYSCYLQYLESLQVLSKHLLYGVGRYIPFIEIMVAFILLSSNTRPFGIGIMTILLISFTLGLIISIKTRQRFYCSCFGHWMYGVINRFTYGKVGYLFILITILSVQTPYMELRINLFSVITGLVLTLFLLLAKRISTFRLESRIPIEINECKREEGVS